MKNIIFSIIHWNSCNNNNFLQSSNKNSDQQANDTTTIPKTKFASQTK
jgi:hypothetical protein